jgi:hypothetical protein
VTDHRASKQGVWDEEVDGEGPTHPGRAASSSKAGTQATLEEPLRPAVPAENELDSAIELLRVSIPPAEVAPASAASSGTMSPEAIDSVARFISDPGLVTQNAARDLDAPSRSLAALELLDAPEYGAEPTDLRVQPPPTPGRARPPFGDDLPSIVLGAQVSTRGDATERTRSAIPLTHPLANSIAPGGSAVSTPPRPRRSGRWQIALGVAALAVIGFGSGYLQSRGEHHAASGLPNEREEEDEVLTPRDEPAKPSEQELATRQVAEAEAAREAEAVQQAEGVRQAESERVANEARAVRAPASANDAPATPRTVASGQKAKSMRIALGGARMFERPEEELAAEDSGPVRTQVVEAMNAMTEQLKSCVGDEHGVADVTLTVRAPGVVSHALVEGAFAGSPQGSCIARTLREAKLPPLAEPVTRIAYPIQL